jgi:hypothetical protein
LRELKFETSAIAPGASVPDRRGSSVKSRITEEIFRSTFGKEIARLEKSREHHLQGSKKKVYHVASPQNSILRSKQFFFARERFGGSCS